MILLKLWNIFTFEVWLENIWIIFLFHYVGKLIWVQGLDWEFCSHPEAGSGRKAPYWLQLSQCASTMVTNSAFKNIEAIRKRWSKVTRSFSLITILKVQRVQSWPVSHRQLAVFWLVWFGFFISELHCQFTYLLLTNAVSRYFLNCKISFLASGLNKWLVIVGYAWNTFFARTSVTGLPNNYVKIQSKDTSKSGVALWEPCCLWSFSSWCFLFIQAVREVFVVWWCSKYFFWKLQLSC